MRSDRNPIISLMAERRHPRARRNALPVDRQRDPRDREARARRALRRLAVRRGARRRIGMALHHKLCHTLGGTFDLPHAETHAVVLPHAIAYNAPAAPELLAPFSAALAGRPAPRSSTSPRGSARRRSSRILGLRRPTSTGRRRSP